MTGSRTYSATALVINKDIKQLDFLSHLLLKTGLEPLTFTEAKSALKALDKESPPSLIVTDLYMPVIDGWKFCRMLRSPAFEPFNKIPVMVVSSIFSEDMTADIMSDLHADAFLPYPPEEIQFREQAKALIEGKKPEKPSVLIVEDDKNFSYLIKNIFEKHGYIVHTALTASDGAEIFKKISCHIALLNYNLPDRKGDILLSSFSSQATDCICFMMAEEITSELALKWTADGAVFYLKKPFEPEYIIELYKRTRKERIFLETQKILERKTYELTEKKENKEIPEQSEKRFRFMVEKLQSGAVYIENNQIFPNRAAENITGYTSEEIKTVDEWFKKLYKEKACAIRNFYESDRREGFPSRTVEILTKNGDIRLVEFFSYAEHDRAIWLMSDITDRKKTEDLLRESEAKILEANQIMSAILEHTHIMAVLLDPQFNFIWVNRAYGDTCGYAPSFFFGKNHFDLYPHEENQRIFQRVVDTGEPFFVSAKPFEFPDHPERGITYWDWSLIPVKDGESKVTGLVFTLMEVTEKIRVEEALRESEKRYRTVVETMTDTLSIIDTEGYFLYANPQAVKNLSRNMENITGKNIRDLLSTHEAEQLISNYYNTFNSKIPFTGEVKVNFIDKEKWFLNRLIPFEYGINKIPSVLSMSLDITDIKKTEEALKESEKELQWILKSMLNAFVLFESVFDDKGNFISYRFVYINDAYEKITGVKSQDVKGKTVHEVWPETEDEWVKRYGEVAVSGISQTFDMYHNPTGKIYHCNVYRPLDTQNRFCVIFEDITEKKKTEESLKESEKKFRSYIENAPDGIFLADEMGNYRLVNDAACRITGFTREELLQKNFKDLVFPDDIQRGIEHFKTIIKHGKATGEFRFTTKSGQIRHWIVKAVKLNEKNFMGFTVDITERRMAEYALRDSETQLKKVLEILPVGVCITDKHGRIIKSNPAAEQIWRKAKHRDTEEIHLYNTRWYDTKEIIKPEECIVRRAIKNGEISREKLIEIECADGTYRVILTWVIPMTGANQEIEGSVSINQDITERKLMEEKLKSAYIKLESLWSVSFMANTDIKTISDHILASLTKMTGSEYGFYGFINEDESVMTIHSWSGEAMKDCSLVNKPAHFSVEEAGVWAEAIRQREPFVLNDYNGCHIAKKGLPEGHVGLNNLLVLPFFSQGKITSLAAVANRQLPYSHEDISQITSFLSSIQAIVEHRRTEETLQLMADMLDEAPGSITVHDGNGKFLYANRKTFEIHGYNKEEFLSFNLHDIDVPESAGLIKERIEYINRHGEASFEVKHIKKDGTILPLNVFVKKVMWKDIPAMLSIATDITERKTAEEEKERLQSQLLQAQKMESVGRLAGGVAHDFNNMLGIILGLTELALEDLEPGHELYESLKGIKKAASRSADLTRQLLAFARKQTIAPKVLDLNDTVSGMLRMIRRLIGEDIDLAWMPGANLWPVMIDPAQIDQILANLCVNARDAIKGVGKVTIETENITFDNNYCASHTDFKAGEFVMLSVSDDGCGMEKDVTEHLFEPFFTTKEIGKGTGLGLATVYGIVRQNRGFINIYSEPDIGSTFKIYLPRFSGKNLKTDNRGMEEAIQKGSEIVLLVEDEQEMMDMIKIMLERLGYRVLAASNPGQAISMAEDYPEEINLLITDVVMPEMNGRDLAEKLMSLYGNMKCLFMSGYTANVIAHHGVLEGGLMFIEKPFTRKDLAAKIRKALAQGESHYSDA